MIWRDFRDFLNTVDKRGHLKVVHGAECKLEIGALTELMCERNGPMLVFDRIPGYPEGYRIATKPYSTPLRSALALGLPEDVAPFEMFKMWKAKFSNYRPIPPREISTGPVMENVLERDRVDLLQFPTPLWHEGDGGLYFGTGCAVITRDPEENWVNIGTYRCMLHDAKTLGIMSGPSHHGTLQMRKWWAEGKSCPIAMAVTVDPYLFCASTNGVPWGTTEYDYAGFIKGEPLEVIPGPMTRLPFPANAELIVEGEVPCPDEERREEGPFGEYTGYYAGDKRLRPVIRVRAVYHRTHPILHGEPPLKPPIDTWACPPAGSILRVWSGLENSGIPGVKGVYALNAGGGLVTAVSVKQQYAGHASQVGRVASGLMHSMCRLMVVVDEDIDPSNTEEVLWAIATRTDPETSFEIERGCRSGPLDPMISPERKKRGEQTSSRALIIACRPWEWLNEFPAVSKASEELRQKVYAKWRDLFEGPRAT
jgi:4-hydroxy-3-polyprenylbenzoate decarboxylase